MGDDQLAILFTIALTYSGGQDASLKVTKETMNRIFIGRPQYHKKYIITVEFMDWFVLIPKYVEGAYTTRKYFDIVVRDKRSLL